VRQVSLWVRGTSIRNSESNEKVAFKIQFYHSERQPMQIEYLEPWEGTFDWKKVGKNLPVPAKAREAICRVGLNGAVGLFSDDDDVRVSAPPTEK
jgi:hypothetical protein